MQLQMSVPRVRSLTYCVTIFLHKNEASFIILYSTTSNWYSCCLQFLITVLKVLRCTRARITTFQVISTFQIISVLIWKIEKIVLKILFE